MSCHEGYDHPCRNKCIYPKCHELKHLSDPSRDYPTKQELPLYGKNNNG